MVIGCEKSEFPSTLDVMNVFGRRAGYFVSAIFILEFF